VCGAGRRGGRTCDQLVCASGQRSQCQHDVAHLPRMTTCCNHSTTCCNTIQQAVRLSPDADNNLTTGPNRRSHERAATSAPRLGSPLPCAPWAPTGSPRAAPAWRRACAARGRRGGRKRAAQTRARRRRRAPRPAPATVAPSPARPSDHKSHTVRGGILGCGGGCLGGSTPERDRRPRSRTRTISHLGARRRNRRRAHAPCALCCWLEAAHAQPHTERRCTPAPARALFSQLSVGLSCTARMGCAAQLLRVVLHRIMHNGYIRLQVCYLRVAACRRGLSARQSTCTCAVGAAERFSARLRRTAPPPVQRNWMLAVQRYG
jgi:hypothetical protein